MGKLLTPPRRAEKDDPLFREGTTVAVVQKPEPEKKPEVKPEPEE